MLLMIVLAVLGAWLLVSVLLALAFGRAVRFADRHHGRAVAYRAATAPMRARTAS